MLGGYPLDRNGDLNDHGAMMAKTNKIPDARELAILCMMEVEDKHVLVSHAMSRLGITLAREEMNLAHELVYGTFRHLSGIDERLKRFCRKPLSKLPQFVRWLLRCGVYQLLKMRTPDYAVINESVSLTGKKRFPGLKPLVNAILRQVQRSGSSDDLQADLLPEWFKRKLVEAFGHQWVESWASYLKQPPILSYWDMEDSPSQKDTEDLPHCKTGEKVGLKGHYFQNASAQAVSELVCRSKASSILDYCAAPGGKSFYIKKFGQANTLQACDISADRLALMSQNANRLGLEIETLNLIEREPEPQGFDFVLVDAPCSALGIMSRHPEIGFLRQMPPEPSLFETQKTIVEKAWHYLAPDGFFLYVICTPNPYELPPWPSGSEPADEELKAWLHPSVKFTQPSEGCFLIEPSNRFDAFSGFLLKKIQS